MFDKEYLFRGKHAEMVKKMTSPLGANTKAKIFETNNDIYAVAPIIGFLYGRKAEVDRSNNDSTKIFDAKMMSESENLKFKYRLLMLLANKTKDSEEKQRIVFKLDNDDDSRQEYDKLYNEYVLGGVEVLYEKIMENATNVDEFLMNAYKFMEEFNNRYYAEIPDEF